MLNDQLINDQVAESRESETFYQTVVGEVSEIIDSARGAAIRSVDSAMTAAYWLIGRRIVDLEQSGDARAEYGTRLIERLAADLTSRFGRGFSRQNIQNMRLFYVAYPYEQIRQTPSSISNYPTEIPIRQMPSGNSAIHPGTQIRQTPSGQAPHLTVPDIMNSFPLPWSAYVRLLSLKNPDARVFYETEALRGDRTIRIGRTRQQRNGSGISSYPAGRAAPGRRNGPH